MFKYDICASTLLHLVTRELNKCPWLMFTKCNFLYLHIISEILVFDAFLPRNTWIFIFFLSSLTIFGLYFRTKFHLDNILNNIFGFKSIISILDLYLSYLFYILFSLFSFLPIDQQNITFLIYNMRLVGLYFNFILAAKLKE